MEGPRGLRNKVNAQLALYHSNVPGIRRLPFPVIAVISALLLVNAIAWVAIGIILVWNPQ